MKAWLFVLLFSSCAGFQAQRVDKDISDEKALEITDEWLQKDTEQVVDDLMKKMDRHKGLSRFLQRRGHSPAVFVGDVQNMTSNAYFPIKDMTDELLEKLSGSGDFILVDAHAREKILKEITYQHDGMVNPATIKKIGRQTGADLVIFGNVYMKAKTRKGKTIKQYSVNIRMTDLEKGVEVLRVRTKISKYSKQGGMGW